MNPVLAVTPILRVPETSVAPLEVQSWVSISNIPSVMVKVSVVTPAMSCLMSVSSVEFTIISSIVWALKSSDFVLESPVPNVIVPVPFVYEIVAGLPPAWKSISSVII